MVLMYPRTVKVRSKSGTVQNGIKHVTQVVAKQSIVAKDRSAHMDQ